MKTNHHHLWRTSLSFSIQHVKSTFQILFEGAAEPPPAGTAYLRSLHSYIIISIRQLDWTELTHIKMVNISDRLDRAAIFLYIKSLLWLIILAKYCFGMARSTQHVARIARVQDRVEGLGRSKIIDWSSGTNRSRGITSLCSQRRIIAT